MSTVSRHRGSLVFAVIALAVSFYVTRGLIARPGYTDAFYHFNAANRLVSGDGLTDAYLWTYLGDPESLPVPSHLYWMPFTSLIAAFGMWLVDAPGNYAAAQWPFALMLAGTAGVGYWLGGKTGGTNRHRWMAGLLTLFSGFFVRFWGATDTFAPYALAGSLCLLLLGLGTAARSAGWHGLHTIWLLGGVFAGLGHLTRADGALLLLVGYIVVVWPGPATPVSENRARQGLLRSRLLAAVAMTAGYLVVMGPWFARNVGAVGSPLPVGGIQAAWFTDYNDLFSYPVEADVQTLFADGPGAFVESRWIALTNNLGTFIAVEGLVVMAPLMLTGLWTRRKDPFLRAFWLYALGLHLVMTLVFPFPGYRGGLFHSAAALVPWWAALGAVGLDDVVDWVANRRRHWRRQTAKAVFSAGLIVLALMLSFRFGSMGRVPAGTPSLYQELLSRLPSGARIMINDPAQLYYFTGFWGVVLPNETPDTIPVIARRYGVTYLLVEYRVSDGAMAVPEPLVFDLDNPPDFLTPISNFNFPGTRLYAITAD